MRAKFEIEKDIQDTNHELDILLPLLADENNPQGSVSQQVDRLRRKLDFLDNELSHYNKGIIFSPDEEDMLDAQIEEDLDAELFSDDIETTKIHFYKDGGQVYSSSNLSPLSKEEIIDLANSVTAFDRRNRGADEIDNIDGALSILRAKYPEYEELDASDFDSDEEMDQKFDDYALSYYEKGGEIFSPTTYMYGKEVELITVYDENDHEEWQDNAQYLIDSFRKQGLKAGVVHKGNLHGFYVEMDSHTYGIGGVLAGLVIGGYAGYKYGLTKEKRRIEDLFTLEKKFAKEYKKRMKKQKDERKFRGEAEYTDYEEVYAKGGRVMSIERLAQKLVRAYPHIRMSGLSSNRISIYEPFPTDRKGNSIADYYSESQDRTFGVINHFNNFLERNGYWAEWQNPEHLRIWKKDYAKGGKISSKDQYITIRIDEEDRLRALKVNQQPNVYIIDERKKDGFVDFLIQRDGEEFLVKNLIENDIPYNTIRFKSDKPSVFYFKEPSYAKGGKIEVGNNIPQDEVKDFVDMFNDMDEEDFGEAYENITGEDFYDEGISRKEATTQIIENLDSMDSEGYDLEMVRLGLYKKGGKITKNDKGIFTKHAKVYLKQFYNDDDIETTLEADYLPNLKKIGEKSYSVEYPGGAGVYVKEEFLLTKYSLKMINTYDKNAKGGKWEKLENYAKGGKTKKSKPAPRKPISIKRGRDRSSSLRRMYGFAKGGWIDFKSKREINKIKKELEKKGDTYSIQFDPDGSRFGIKGGGRYRITSGEYLSTTYAKGGVLSFKTTKEADKYLQGLSDEDFKKLGDFALVYNGKEYLIKKNFKPVGYAKGGTLDKEFKFDKNFVVYVPSTSDVGKKISKKELDKRVDEVERFVANEFGGYTETDTDGGYKSTSGEIIEEDIVKVSVFANNKDWEDNEKKVVSKVKRWAKDWGQEAIGFEYEGDLYYIDNEGKYGIGGFLWGLGLGVAGTYAYQGYKRYPQWQAEVEAEVKKDERKEKRRIAKAKKDTEKYKKDEWKRSGSPKYLKPLFEKWADKYDTPFSVDYWNAEYDYKFLKQNGYSDRDIEKIWKNDKIKPDGSSKEKDRRYSSREKSRVYDAPKSLKLTRGKEPDEGLYAKGGKTMSDWSDSFDVDKAEYIDNEFQLFDTKTGETSYPTHEEKLYDEVREGDGRYQGKIVKYYELDGEQYRKEFDISGKDFYAKGGELEDKYKVISITRVVGGMNPKFRVKFKDGKVMRSDEQNEFIDSKYYKSMNRAISEYEYEEPIGPTSHEDLYNYAKGGRIKKLSNIEKKRLERRIKKGKPNKATDLIFSDWTPKGFAKGGTIRKGDYVRDSRGELGLVNKVKKGVAYVKYPSTNEHAFEPVFLDSIKIDMSKGYHKGRKVYVDVYDK